MEQTRKECTRCKEFKSVNLFYKQGGRYESLCKDCKKHARKGRHQESFEVQKFSQTSAGYVPVTGEISPKGKPKTYEDLGLTKNEFMEVVEFFKELMRLDQKGR